MNPQFSPLRAPRAPRPRWHAFTLVALLLTFLISGFGAAPRAAQAQIIDTVAGNGSRGFDDNGDPLPSGDGGQATAATVHGPTSVTFDRAGNLYIVEFNNHRVRKVDRAGVISTFAGTGEFGFSGDGGPATEARLANPVGAVADAAGNLYIADSQNNRVRKVDTDGIITTFAGGAPRFDDDGDSLPNGDGNQATASNLRAPYDVIFDSAGNLYISEFNGNRIRKVDSNGIISTFAGTNERDFSGDGGQATAATLGNPGQMAFDRAGNLYFAELSSQRIRRVDGNGIISTFAGGGDPPEEDENGTPVSNGDGGQATATNLSTPAGVAFDSAGNLYISEASGARIRKVNSNGVISTFAGTGEPDFSGDGGPATEAQLNFNFYIAFDGTGNLYIADFFNNRVRIVTLAVENKPTADDVAGSGASGQSIVVPLTGSDPDGGFLFYSITQQPANGSADIRTDDAGNSSLFYRSNDNFGGTDTVKFVATNKEGVASDEATATFTITQLAPPTANSVSGRGASGQRFVLPLSGSDPAGGGLTYVITREPTNGQAAIRTDGKGNSALFYTSNAGYKGADTVKFVATDSLGRQSATATGRFVLSGQAPPTANNVRGSGASGQTIVLPLAGSDPVGRGLTYRITQNAASGDAVIRRDNKGNSALFYTSRPGFDGTDLVRFIAIDSQGAQSNGARAIVTIKATAAVRANNVSGRGASGQTIVLPLSGVDPTGGGLSYAITGQPTNGNADIRTDSRGNSAIFYRSQPGFIGGDSVQFVAVDSLGRRSLPATASLTVTRARSNSAQSANAASASAPSAGAS